VRPISEIKSESLYNFDGFTLVEILVTISLIIIFTVTALGFNRTSDQQIALFREQGKVINEIYKARSLAVTTFNRTSQSEGVPCGYGIHIESPDQLIIFEDFPAGLANSECEQYTQVVPGLYGEGTDKVFEVANLNGVSMSFCAGGGQEPCRDSGPIDPLNPVDILFVPPNPTVFSNKTFPFRIYLTAPLLPTSPLVIEINQFGQISVQ
jgi:type II secretory pathway pseudopilin PulG